MTALELAETLVAVRVADHSGSTPIRWALWLVDEAGQPVEWLAQTYCERSARGSLRLACVHHVAGLLERGARTFRDGQLEIP